MQNPLALKLQRYADLSKDEIRKLEQLTGDRFSKNTGEDIVQQGERPMTVALILEGLACRYKLSDAGERQIVGIMVPGDLCDLHAFVLNAMDHSIAALSPVTLTHVPRDKLMALFESEPRITRALWWSTMVDEGTLREWVMNVAKRSAYAGVAHLLSELCMRLQTVGLASEDQCEINMRQEDLADAVGVGRSHLNASIAQLEEEGLIRRSRGSLTIIDISRLMKAGQFNEDYLHLHKASRGGAHP
jgi:CRP-like cAMP-binding protein